MNVSEKIRTLRKSKGMSQEELAGQVNISRQAVSRWENGTALPDADNIVQLSKLFGVTTDYLLMDSYESDEDSPKIKENNKILHANLTSLAIILQATFLNICMLPWEDPNTKVYATVIKVFLLLAQWIVAVVGYKLHIGFWAGVMLCVNGCVYITIVNPKYMNRKLTR